ncbi:T9SS type A sorting domain-containing protein [bacterium]|nr:T9SS type A sorting domain-containing protein [bacterium]
MRIYVLFVTALLLAVSPVIAGTVVHNITLETPQVTSIADGYHKVTMDAGMVTGEVGDPQLPVLGLNLLLPAGEEASAVNVTKGELISLGKGYKIKPVQQGYPLSFRGPIEETPENEEVYSGNAFFPAQMAAKFHTDFYCGHGIAAIALNPVVYNPVTGELAYYRDFTVTVETKSTPRSLEAITTKFKHSPRRVSDLEKQINNPETVTAVYGPAVTQLDEPYYDILLITHSNLVDYWDDYIEWKTKCGYYIAVELVSDIYANYGGVDNPEKIRNCIIDYYETYDILYVFLAGDDEALPHRGLYDNQGAYTDNDIAGDCYFAGLDGTWNDDGDSHWGEPDEADLRAEVFVSRAAVDSQNEIYRFVNKQIMYQCDPVVDEVETALMTGEDLGWPIWADEYKEEIRTGSSSWGFITEPFPANFYVATLYDTPGNLWSAMGDLVPRLNMGPIYVNHLGHCNIDYMMKLDDYQVNTTNMTNNGVNHNFYLIYSQGCYCGSFDNRTTGGSHLTTDCITEFFSVMETGAVALITNSRYGWGDLTTTQGSSQYYDKQFFDAIWGEGLTIASEAQTDSKTDCIPYIDYAQNRWCFYDLNLFSEPTLDLWTAEPQVLAANHAAEIFLGTPSMQVEVPGIEGARVCLSMNGVIHGVGFTDEIGICTLIMSTPILTLGPADLYVTAHDYLPYEGSVTVIPPTGAYVVYNACQIEDAVSGNNNGQWDYGETVDLTVTVINLGVEDASDVTVEITTEDELVTIINGSCNFGNIPQGQTATVENAFTVEVAPEAEDGHYAAFVMTAISGYDDWTSYFNLQVNAPDIVYNMLEIDDSAGNGNGNIDPGETAIMTVYIENEGGCFATDVEGIVSTIDPYITITSANIEFGDILSGEIVSGSFNLVCSESCPQEHDVDFILDLTDAIGYSGSVEFMTTVGNITYDPTGPDIYGYLAYDPNDAPEFPEYEWVEISADSGGPGTLVNFTQDDQTLQFDLPFTFQYYGQDFTRYTIATNGWIGMGDIMEEDYNNSGIPDPDGPAGMIAAYWEDLSPQRPNSGRVWRWYDSANHRLIVEYNHVEQYAPTGNFETFEAILYDPAYYTTATGDGRILVLYKDMSQASASEGTIGIESPDETDGLQILFDGALEAHAMMLADGMCYLYSTVSAVPTLQVTLTPVNPPIVIPATGGTFQYHLDILNNGSDPALFDAWIEVTLPSGSSYDPNIGRDGLNLAPGSSLGRDMTQNVPAGAPAGSYTYILNTGNHVTGDIWAFDSFDFTKSGVDLSGSINNWNLIGWDGMETSMGAPAEFFLAQNHPNPFNPVTTIAYGLPEAADVKLVVYNTLGQVVMTLVDGWQDAGFKTVKVDAKELSSGLYFYKISAGSYSAAQKMLLIK